jgi:ABC-type glutathione transport system ATPase component
VTDPLLTVRDLSKSYACTLALSGVSFTLSAGKTLGVVGASGSGKSTLARCLAGFESPTSGEIRFAGDRLQIQLIFQQPAASLNPRFTAAEIVEEPLVIQRRGSTDQRRLDPALVEQISRLLDELQQRVGLTYILISHDLDLVAALASEIAVMDSGRLVEHAPKSLLMSAPQHPRTRELLAATLALGGLR